MSCFLFFFSNYIQIIRPIIPNEGAPVIITLDRTASASQFVKILKEKKLIHSDSALLMMIRFSGLSSQLKAGVYQIKPGETAMQLVHRIVAGDVLTQNFTVISGTTQQKISQDLAKAAYLNYSPEDWRSIQDDHPNAEGLLLADTYQYHGGSSGKSLLEYAHRNLINYLNISWTNRAPNLPYKTPYEMLIAASIIEKETAVPQERKLISGVMVNRLNKKMPLQMDPTVIYGLGAAYKGSFLIMICLLILPITHIIIEVCRQHLLLWSVKKHWMQQLIHNFPTICILLQKGMEHTNFPKRTNSKNKQLINTNARISNVIFSWEVNCY